jgi:hypothetical protein
VEGHDGVLCALDTEKHKAARGLDTADEGAVFQARGEVGGGEVADGTADAGGAAEEAGGGVDAAATAAAGADAETFVEFAETLMVAAESAEAVSQVGAG